MARSPAIGDKSVKTCRRNCLHSSVPKLEVSSSALTTCGKFVSNLCHNRGQWRPVETKCCLKEPWLRPCFIRVLVGLEWSGLDRCLVEQDASLSNQFFSILEEWESVLRGLGGNILLDMPEPEFWPENQFSISFLKPDRFDPAFLFAQPPGWPGASRYPVPLSKKVMMNVRKEKIRFCAAMFPRIAGGKSMAGAQCGQYDD